MQVIQHVRLTGSQTNITFTSIPATFTDLMLKLSIRLDQNSDNSIFLQFNGVTTNTYSYRYLFGSGSGTGSAAASATNIAAGIGVVNTYTANTFGNSEIYIPNYRSNVAKLISGDNVQENNATQAFLTLVAGIWTGTDPIASIRLFPVSGNFVAGSSATLYGILSGSSNGVTVS